MKQLIIFFIVNFFACAFAGQKLHHKVFARCGLLMILSFHFKPRHLPITKKFTLIVITQQSANVAGIIQSV